MKATLAVTLLAIACIFGCSPAHMVAAGRTEAEKSDISQQNAVVISWDSGTDFIGSDVEAWLELKGGVYDEDKPEVITEEAMVEADGKVEALVLDLQTEWEKIVQMVEESKRESLVAYGYKERKAAFDAKRSNLEKAISFKQATVEGFERYSAWREN